MAAHPTTYGGVNFRSRLEARWAAFFDLAAWRWEYEPVDDDGWTPDFLLVGRDRAVAVEVKPIEWPSTDIVECKTVVLNRGDLAKVRRSDRKEVLILGAYPPPLYFYHEFTTHSIGFLWAADGWPSAQSVMTEPKTVDVAETNGWFLPHYNSSCAFDLSGYQGDSSPRIGGEESCRDYRNTANMRARTRNDVTLSWAEAGNRVQWMGQRC